MTQWFMNNWGRERQIMWRRIQMFPKITLQNSFSYLAKSKGVEMVGPETDRNAVHLMAVFWNPSPGWLGEFSRLWAAETSMMSVWRFGTVWGKKPWEWQLLGVDFRMLQRSPCVCGRDVACWIMVFRVHSGRAESPQTCKDNTRKEESFESIFLHSYICSMWNVNTRSLLEGIRASTKQHLQRTIVCNTQCICCKLYVRKSQWTGNKNPFQGTPRSLTSITQPSPERQMRGFTDEEVGCTRKRSSKPGVCWSQKVYWTICSLMRQEAQVVALNCGCFQGPKVGIKDLSCETGWRLKRKRMNFSKWKRLIWYYLAPSLTYHVFMHGIFSMWDWDPTSCCRIVMATTRFRVRGILPGLKATTGSLGEEILSEVLGFFRFFLLIGNILEDPFLTLKQHLCWMKKDSSRQHFWPSWRNLVAWSDYGIQGNHHGIQGNHHWIH